MEAVVSSYTLTPAREIVGNGHTRLRDVSGESCLTVTNTLVPYILSLIYAVPCVYRLSPTHSFHIYRLSCVWCLVSMVYTQHTRVVSCVSYVWCLVSTVYTQHTRVVSCVSYVWCLVSTVYTQHTRVVSCVSYVWCLVSMVYTQHTRVVSCVSYVWCLVSMVYTQHTRVVSCVSYVWCLVSMVYTQHTRVALNVAGSNYSNQLQLIATDTHNTFNIASPPDSNEASSLTFCKHPHYLLRLICFELFCNIHFAAFISSRN
jgi:hypothetical protein